MTKLSKILIAIGLGLIVTGILIWLWKSPTPQPVPTPSVGVDTTKYTDVVLKNSSDLDSVQVFVTMSNMTSIIGKFGMDSSNIVTYCQPDSIPCVGSFWAKKGVEYHLNDTTALSAIVVTWGLPNQACFDQA